MSYLDLREGVGLLASPAPTQVEWLDWLFGTMTGGGSAEGFGNYELIANFSEDVIALDYLVNIGQVTSTEAAAMRKLDDFIGSQAPYDDGFWLRRALASDERWEQIRIRAKATLLELPDKASDPEWVRRFGEGGNSKAIPAG